VHHHIDLVDPDDAGPWADDVAAEINNKLQLGLTDAEYRKLRMILAKRAWNAFSNA
jgi:hypothetical protein